MWIHFLFLFSLSRCGEDERPLNELLILQLGSEHPNGRYNVAMCKVFSNHWSQEKRKFLRSETAVCKTVIQFFIKKLLKGPNWLTILIVFFFCFYWLVVRVGGGGICVLLI
jgi:hypothetical protein